jgi:site-specific recombinase XerD
MFDRLFKPPRAVARQWNGPLAEERCRYLAHCAAQQMTGGSLRVIAIYTLVIAKTLRLADRPGELITRAEIEAGADRYVRHANHRRHPRRPKKLKGGYLWKSFRDYAIRWLTFLGRLQTPSPAPRPYGEHVAQFKEYMHRERGLTPPTITVNSLILQGFLEEIDQADLRLKTLTVAQVNDLLVKKVHEHGYARNTIRRWATVLRPFFRFAEARAWCRPGLADGVTTPRVYRYEGLPVGPSWDDVKRLLAAVQGDRPADIRNRALLLLLAVYGLRSGEVTALRLEDFDWEREVLTVPRGKCRQPRTYPLCRSVGDAVLCYLRDARPRSDRREVFLTLAAPFRPLGDGGLRNVVGQRLHALGLILPHYGTHALRHACATHLLSQGLSLKEIGDHLGHRSLQSTRIYAKVDLAALRTVGDFNLEGLL